MCTGAGEPLIGLKLGKRTYFENFASTDIETSSAVCLLPSASVKRPSICHQSIQHSYCQVEGCNVDLTTAKEYHRKHRVCESHSKSPKVIISGHERRFCQQCSRFHDLSEFDQKKRSCRRRLSEHNARRRKPQPDSHSFHPVKLTSSTFYGERGQMDFFPNWTPFSNLRSSSCCLRNDSHGFSLSLSKGSWSKPTKVVADGQLLLPLDFSNVDTPSCNDLSKFMPLKCATAEVLNQGLEAPASAFNLNRAPDLHRALSLLSSDVWIPPSTAQGDTFPLGSSVSDVVSHPTVQVVNSAPACWLHDERSLSFNIHSSGSQIQELNQLFSTSNGHFLEFRT
ncbi:hypothetical protein HPP92_017713 [Vanilla planifolia]|uniref:SBP-type domain-containing protein n=1 Tax=Vanilla planifolia TaxID=51239 RepID=A0A835UPW8_VANPL|nr:hypothetical protein HPP92_018321 [Vanilla planifolia]KAG0468385.1 hypothetical protein HPP92_017713 [Vanilla planifolia]